VAILTDFIIKGVPNINVSAVYAAVVASLEQQDASMNYTQLGYVPVEADQRGASQTLEYAFDDAVAARLATFVGDAPRAAAYSNRSLSYRNIYSDAQLSMCPRYANGTIQCPSDLSLPHPFNPWYTEGDTVEWTWFVEGDPAGLLALFPNASAYVSYLQETFYNSYFWPFSTALPNPWQWQGNEPRCVHACACGTRRGA
jgi:putative alpha-1,2-mannosidase